MERGRTFAHIFEIDSLEVKAYLLPGTDSLVQGHLKGISKIARIGSYVIINSAGARLVGVVHSLHVMEPEKLFWIKTKADYPDRQLIRTISINLIGQFYHEAGREGFERGINSYPSIDEEVMAPTQDELDLILNERVDRPRELLDVGLSYPTNDITIRLDPVRLFSRHCGVFGSTGNGKSCTVTVIINELLAKNVGMSIFVFDINGEYTAAFKKIEGVRVLKFVGELPAEHRSSSHQVRENLKLNYASFSRSTLRSILKPSEKTQIPALNFASDSLAYLPLALEDISVPNALQSQIPKHLRDNPKARLFSFLSGDPSETDPGTLERAFDTVRFLTIATALQFTTAKSQPIKMSVLAKVIADRWGIMPRNNGLTYDGFRYGNVASLCDRVTELCRDKLFGLFCDTKGEAGIDLRETTGVEPSAATSDHPPLTIFDLSMIPQEYISIVVDGMLEQHLLEALNRTFVHRPHLLVLDEAHHYLGTRNTWDNEAVYLSNPPGERIAKEGRKYGLHMLVSSQRPREMSGTIMSQIGTVITHALTHEADRNVISGFGTYNDKTILNSLSILPRREAIVVGQAISMPTRFKVNFLDEAHRPSSHDPLEALRKPVKDTTPPTR